MNALDVMKYGNQTLMSGLDGLDQSYWSRPNVCGWWSVKDILAHLTSYELALEEILEWVLDDSKPLALVMSMSDGQAFNDAEVGKRKDTPADKILVEYREAHARVMDLLAKVPEEKRRQTGVIPWYGLEYDLEDMLTYMFYGHKREHTAQINVFKDVLKAEGEPIS